MFHCVRLLDAGDLAATWRSIVARRAWASGSESSGDGNAGRRDLLDALMVRMDDALHHRYGSDVGVLRRELNLSVDEVEVLLRNHVRQIHGMERTNGVGPSSAGRC